MSVNEHRRLAANLNSNILLIRKIVVNSTVIGGGGTRVGKIYAPS